MPTNLRTSTHTARKKHQCDYCLQKIVPGEKYEYTAYVCDGDFYVWKNHFDCALVAHELNMFDDADEGVNDAIFHEYVGYAYNDIMSKKYKAVYESADFVMPPFAERLKFVIRELKESVKK